MKHLILSLMALLALIVFSMKAAEPLLAFTIVGPIGNEEQPPPTVGDESYLSYVPLADELPQFKVNHPQILWAVPTNQMGKSFWTYKVVPQEFPVEGINYLLSLGGFTNRVTASQGLGLLNSNKTIQVVVRPEVGYIRYRDFYAEANHWDRTNHLWEQVAGVPTTNEVEGMGLKLLEKFGITREDLAHNRNGHLRTFGGMSRRSYYDRRTNQDVDNEVTAQGIFFIRRLDGINFGDIGVKAGCEALFGNHAKLSQFQLMWRNYQRDKCYRMASQDEIIQRILDGKALLSRKNAVVAADVKSLTITGIIPAFIGANEFEYPEFLYPFAAVEATADMGTNRVGIELYCPILSTNRVNP